MLRYDKVEIDYEPYPIGLISGVFDDKTYNDLLTTYPSQDLFAYMPKLGNKYSLSSSNNPKQYYQYLKDHPNWAKFHDYILSKQFIEHTLDMLNKNNIDLGIKKYSVASRWPGKRTTPISRLLGRSELSARFEFSMMNGQGGHIRPHTDTPRKHITFVFSMVGPDEWNQEWGGGTAVVWPKDKRLSYNQTNKYLNFDEVNLVKEYDFNPNQALIFIKTFNSWHAVTPMRTPHDKALRKTLTVNIESRA